MSGRVTWALSAALAAADLDLVRACDAAVRTGEARAAGRVSCRLGCTDCCIGPFDITALDAARLARGLAALDAASPAAAAAVRRRAVEQWRAMAPAFPGDPGTGALADDDAARERFFGRFAGVPCPALDPSSGACLLYEARPISCRTYGLPARFGGDVLPACPKNLVGATAAEAAAATVEPDPEDREGDLLRMSEEAGLRRETTVAAALGGAS